MICKLTPVHRATRVIERGAYCVLPYEAMRPDQSFEVTGVTPPINTQTRHTRRLPFIQFHHRR